MSNHSKQQVIDAISAALDKYGAAQFNRVPVCQTIYDLAAQPLLNTILLRNKTIIEQQTKVNACEDQRVACLEYIKNTDAEILGLRNTICNRDKELEFVYMAVAQLNEAVVITADRPGEAMTEILAAGGFLKEAKKLHEL